MGQPPFSGRPPRPVRRAVSVPDDLHPLLGWNHPLFRGHGLSRRLGRTTPFGLASRLGRPPSRP